MGGGIKGIAGRFVLINSSYPFMQKSTKISCPHISWFEVEV